MVDSNQARFNFHPNQHIKNGDELPNHTFYEPTTTKVENQVQLHDLLKNKKVLVLGVPGAFTPDCSNQVPSFIKLNSEFKQLGIDTMICIAVNDPWVMRAWGKDNEIYDNHVFHFLADPKAEYAKLIGLPLDLSSMPHGNVRMARFVALVDNKIIKHIEIEPDGLHKARSDAEPFLQAIKKIL